MITTEYKGPTDHRGSRVIARGAQGRVTIPWDPALGASDNHAAAARAYARRYLASTELVEVGQTLDGARAHVALDVLRGAIAAHDAGSAE